MTDCFALLEQPRRPWLDPEALKEKYHQLARMMHPDQTGTAGNFAELNEAYRTLLDPKLRLRHLLELEAIPMDAGAAPDSLSNFFLETGMLIQETDRLLARSTSSALSKAMVQSELMEKGNSIAGLLSKLQDFYGAALEEVKAIDRNWTSPDKMKDKLSDLVRRFAYLGRWIAQLEERKLRLSI